VRQRPTQPEALSHVACTHACTKTLPSPTNLHAAEVHAEGLVRDVAAADSKALADCSGRSRGIMAQRKGGIRTGSPPPPPLLLPRSTAPTAADTLIVSDVERVPHDPRHTSPRDTAPLRRVVQLGDETLL
jgi:hypothetical protein